MTHVQACERRQKIARDVSRGLSREKAARKYGVCLKTIFLACREHGVNYPALPRGRPKSRLLQIVAGLLGGKAVLRLAKQLRIPREYIDRVRREAIAAGIRFPALPRKRKGD